MRRFCFTLLAGFLAVLPSRGQSFDPDKSYTLATADGLVLDAQSSVQPETSIVLAKPEAGNTSQVWQIRPLDQGVYQLVNGYSYMGLDNASGNDEHTVLQWQEERLNPNQQWWIKPVGDGSYTLTCVASGLSLGLRRPGRWGDPAWQLHADPESPLQRWLITESAT